MTLQRIGSKQICSFCYQTHSLAALSRTHSAPLSQLHSLSSLPSARGLAFSVESLRLVRSTGGLGQAFTTAFEQTQRSCPRVVVSWHLPCGRGDRRENPLQAPSPKLSRASRHASETRHIRYERQCKSILLKQALWALDSWPMPARHFCLSATPNNCKAETGPRLFMADFRYLDSHCSSGEDRRHKLQVPHGSLHTSTELPPGASRAKIRAKPLSTKQGKHI